jgi:hypothetical protein
LDRARMRSRAIGLQEIGSEEIGFKEISSSS